PPWDGSVYNRGAACNPGVGEYRGRADSPHLFAASPVVSSASEYRIMEVPMRRRAFLASGGLGLAGAAALAAPAIAQSQPEIKWRLASSFPKSLDTLFGAVERFTKHIAEATDNKFQ